MDKPKKEVQLRVAEAIQDDIEKGIIRVDSAFMKQIGVKDGDIVEIEGKRSTVAIVTRAYPADIGLNIIRMDGPTRHNARTSIGEPVKVRSVQVKEAKRVVIAPAKKGVSITVPNPQIFKQGLLGRAVVRGDLIGIGGTRSRRTAMSHSPMFDDIFNFLDETVNFGFVDLKFIVADTAPKAPVIITDATEVVLNPEAVDVKEEDIPEVSYEDIGGLDQEIQKIREMVELPLKHPEIFERLGIEPPKGVLLHGPPGTGKTLLAKAVANETNSNFILINGPEIMSKFYGQSEANIRKKFEDAEKNAPSIIFIDEIDAIASKREETHGEVERRVVAQMLALMDGLKSRGRVIVIAATNIPNALDPALRRPGRFDREIEIGVTNEEGRLKILQIHTRKMPVDNDPKLINPAFTHEALASMLTQASEMVTPQEIIDYVNGLFVDDNDRNRLASFFTHALLELYKKKTGVLLHDDFLQLCMKKLLQGVVGIVRQHVTFEGQKIVLDEHELAEKLKERYDSMLEKDNLQSVISSSVRENILQEVSAVTHGFVGADLAALAKEAAMIVLRRVLPEIRTNEDKPVSKELLEKLKITKSDLLESLKVVRPSALREVFVEVPKVKWEEIGGLVEVKQELKEAVEWPLKNPGMFKRMGVRAPKGILLYGPPGTGKTLLAKAVANESDANFISIKGPELLSKWVGESEKAVREVFHKARQASPTIIFFDEIDSVAQNRTADSESKASERVVNQLLTEMDGISEMNDIIVIGATNRPDILDTALLRPGRFDRIILVPGPDEVTRREILSVHTEKMPLAEDVDLDSIARKTEGYGGADLEAVAREAAIFALREDMSASVVRAKHFDEALKKVRPSITKEIEKNYESLKEKFSQARSKQMQTEKPSYFG